MSTESLSRSGSHSDSEKPTRETGFPEPFCNGNTTTLPHPEADQSPGASISSEDIAINHVHSRRAFLHRHRHRQPRKYSHGRIVPDLKAPVPPPASSAGASRANGQSRTSLPTTTTIPETPADARAPFLDADTASTSGGYSSNRPMTPASQQGGYSSLTPSGSIKVPKHARNKLSKDSAISMGEGSEGSTSDDSGQRHKRKGWRGRIGMH